MALQDHLNPSWRAHLAEELKKEYWHKLDEFVSAERAAHPGKIYPPPEQVFAALNHVEYDEVRVVILGQDPYHGPRQAHGLSFSVNGKMAKPPSLLNILKELQNDLGYLKPNHGSLESWAKQGVLLLNTVLTVRHKEANSHKSQGWETFTKAVVKELAKRPEHMVFVLWGGQAKKMASLIPPHHTILESAHPSPLSAHRGFFGSAPFSRVNDALKAHGQEPINWKIEDI